MYLFHSKSKFYYKVQLGAYVMAVCLVLMSCSTKSQQNNQQTSPPQITNEQPDIHQAVPVKFTKPTFSLSLPAQLAPYQQVALYAKVSGFVKKLYVDRGDHVQAGQLLAVLEAPEMHQQYLSDKSMEEKLKSDYLYAKQAYERITDASKTSGAVAQMELDRAEGAMQSAKSAYEASKAGAMGSKNLQKYLRIIAPFDGVIAQRNVSNGALVGTNSGQPLFMLAQRNRLRLTLSLPEKYASSVSKGMKATFTVNARPADHFEATLSRTSGLLDQQDRSLTLEFDVNNNAGKLQGGDYAQVTLQLQRQDSTYWVPEQSVVNTQVGVFVLAKNGNNIKRIAVKEGIKIDTLREIFGNLTGEDSILLKPSEELQ